MSLPLILASLLAVAGADDAEPLVTEGEPGKRGGRLVVALTSEPKTFNPVTASDNASRSVISVLTADLVHINRETHRTEPALAKSWEVSGDGRSYTLHLRRGVRFSDGHLLDADDVVFTFQVHLDEKVHSTQRDLLLVGGRPVAVRKLDAHTVRFDLAQPYGAAERLFDGFAVLPAHVLLKPYREGKLGESWGVSADPANVVGLGPFRLLEHVPGERIVLVRNPHYWKADRDRGPLPYLDEVVFQVVPGQEGTTLRFLAGDLHLIDRVTPQDFALLGRRGNLQLKDLGPGLEYNFLFFNLNGLETPRDAQAWFRNVSFRRAVSAALDREALVRLVYDGRATALASHVTGGNKDWVHPGLEPDRYSPERARALLREAGFRWSEKGRLLDRDGRRVSFTVVTNAGNVAREQMATLVQADLTALGMGVEIVTVDFRSLLDRVFQTKDYEACLLGLGSGDVDPTSEMGVWLSSGSTHLWHLGQSSPATEWEEEIDELMRAQMVSTDVEHRRRLYHRVQEIVAEELPLVPLVSPNILVGAAARLGNFRPAILSPYTLWNVEELFFKE